MRSLQAVGLLIALCGGAAFAQPQPCGPHKDRKFDQAVLRDILGKHADWLRDKPRPTIESWDPYYKDPRRANFNCADLRGSAIIALLARDYPAGLSYASFQRANLSNIQDFKFISFHHADFREAKLEGAAFEHMSLASAVFTRSDLTNAAFRDVDLADAKFDSAKLQGVVYEPSKGADPLTIRTASGLEYLSFESNADALLELRDQFKKAGRRDLERSITYAIESTKTRQGFLYGTWLGYVTSALRYVGWELTTGYDLFPSQALAILFGFAGVFALPYAIALMNRRQPRIWRILPKDRLGGDGKDVAEPLRARGLEIPRYAVWFSILSAFQLGWRDLNVGSWINRLQPADYTLRATGWVRTLSGLQSLVSVYLLAMWVLTQFGRLFEG